jgi:uncharacterized protein YaiL (DUF2058 family)
MGNLGDAFKKAGVINKKDLARQRHEERVERKKLGRDGLEKKRSEANQQARQRRDAQRDQDRNTERQRRAALDQGEALAQARDLVKSHALEVRQGRRRFYFEEPDGRLPYLLVDDSLLKKLENAQAAIAHDGLSFRFIDGKTLARVLDLAPELVAYPAR